MLNPHTPSELLEKKLPYAGLTDMPHPKKLCPWIELPWRIILVKVTPWVFEGGDVIISLDPG